MERLWRFLRTVRLVLIQRLQRNIISFKRSWLISPATQPDTLKTIASRADLYQTHVFSPKGFKQLRSSPPLVIMVHGGGFIMNNPAADDPLARFLADTTKSLVISIDYRKAPLHMFPAGYEDVVTSILALLADNELSFDRSRVFLCGSSAGGNLILGAVQDPRLQDKLLGVVAIYPGVNFTVSAEEQLARRPDPTIPDFLGDTFNDLKDIYIGTADPATLSDPRLSPALYRHREDLPRNMFLIGCEHDMLCHEAKLMAEKMIQTDEKYGSDSSVRWEMVKNQGHAFEHFPAKTASMEKERVHAKEELYRHIADWILATAVEKD